MSRNIIDELNEKVEKLEHDKRALTFRCYALTRGVTCIFAGLMDADIG